MAKAYLDRTTTVTYLEMMTPPAASRPQPPGPWRVERLMRPSVRFYRYLYDAVGADWQWVDRRFVPDATLQAEIGDPSVEIHLLSEGGVPAGYGELDGRREGEVKIRYFGLVPEAIGRGLGRWFLEQVVARAWRGRPRRVWVQTCDLDHPRALTTYEAVGFRVFDRRDEPVVTRRG